MDEKQETLDKVKKKGKKLKKEKFDKDKFLKEYDLERMSKSEILNLLNKDLNKEQLLLIADIRFGIPRGSNLRRSKEDVLDLIKDAINYKESLEAIKERASE